MINSHLFPKHSRIACLDTLDIRYSLFRLSPVAKQHSVVLLGPSLYRLRPLVSVGNNGSRNATVRPHQGKQKTKPIGLVFCLAPPAGLEPATSWLTVMRSTDWAKEEYKSQRRPIFPGGFPPSIVGIIELNYRVRNGNGCTLNNKVTDYRDKYRLSSASHLHASLKAYIL